VQEHALPEHVGIPAQADAVVGQADIAFRCHRDSEHDGERAEHEDTDRHGPGAQRPSLEAVRAHWKITLRLPPSATRVAIQTTTAMITKSTVEMTAASGQLK